MKKGRGGSERNVFNDLIDAYANREDGQTIADLYPAIVGWFAAQARPAAGP